MSFNKIIIVGNLGRDPELRYTPQGKAVCKLAVATNEKRRNANSGETESVTTWFRVTLWEKRAETAAKYLFKGSQVYVEGKLHVEEWTDKDGKTRSTLEVSNAEMQFLGSPAEAGGGTGEIRAESQKRAQEARGAAAGAGEREDDLPEFTGAPPEDSDIPF